MAKSPLTDINKLVKAEGFLQVNFIKGFKYIDKAGELVNYFHTPDKKAPQFSMNLTRLVIKNPTDKVEEIKISSGDFWAHFVAPESLEVMESFFQKTCDAITRILEIEEISRVGWRIYFVHEFNNQEQREAVLKKFSTLDGLEFHEAYFSAKFEETSLDLRLSSVVKEGEVGDQVPALLIDIDIYKKYDEGLSSASLLSELLKFKEVIRSEVFLGRVNTILTGHGLD